MNTTRDVSELHILTNFVYELDEPLITLSDGPLELFQEPRSGEEHKILFMNYLQVLHSLCEQDRVMAGYTDNEFPCFGKRIERGKIACVGFYSALKK